MASKSTTAKRPRGRPSHVPTAALRRQVAVAAGGGMRHEDIAIAIGVERHTLTKHYGAELAEAAHKRRLEVLNAMYTAARKGSSSAARIYLATEPQVCAPPLPAGEVVSPAAAGAAAPAAPTKVGKKEQAQADAVTAAAGTDWADILPAAPLQ